MTYLGLPAQVLPQNCSEGIDWDCSHLKLSWGVDPLRSSVMLLSMGFCSSKAVGMRGSVSRWLLCRSHAQLFALGFSIGQLEIWQLASPG